MAGIFISYRRQDSFKDARWLYERLRAEFGRDQVFIDLAGLNFDVDFVESLDTQLRDCRVLLALVGPHWLTAQDGQGRRRLDDPNDFVRIEVRTALERGIRVVPVLVDRAQMPRTADLPDDLHKLAWLQALELNYQDFDADAGKLVREIGGILKLGVPAKPVPKSRPQPYPPPPRPKPTQPQPQFDAELPDPSVQGSGGISIETTGAYAAALAREVVGSIGRINIGQKPKTKWMGGEPSETRRMSGDDNGQEPFANLTPGSAPCAVDALLTVYVSYAWEPASQAFVDKVGERLPADRFEFRRDKTHMKTGDWISRFMAEIGRADRVLVVLSDKYLRSPNCMRELLHLFQRSQGDRANLMGRIVTVILGDLKIDRAIGRAEYIRHWRNEHQALETVFQELGIASMGAADREEWLAIQDFQHRVSDIMAWVTDVLMPRGEDGLDAVLERLQTRMFP